MSILKKVKLSLLASVIILSSQRASALGSEPDDLEGSMTPILHTSALEVFSEDEKTTAGTSSSDAGDLETQKRAAEKRKADFDNISACLSPIGAALRFFENPGTSPRKKEKYKGGMGSSESFEISSPSTKMETETPLQFEEKLPARLCEFEKRFNAVRQNISSDKVKKLQTFNQLYSSFKDVVEIYRKYYPDFQIVPEHELRRHYIKRRSSRNLVKNPLPDNGKKLTSDPHGDSPKFSKDSGRSSIKLALELSPLFQERRTEEELQSSSYNFSLVSPRFTEESSYSPQPLPAPTPSSPPFLQRRKTINGGLPARPMHGSSLPSVHYVPTEESSSSLKSPPVTPRRTEKFLSSQPQPLPMPTLSSLPPLPRQPLPKIPTLRTIPSFDSPAETQGIPAPSPLSQELSSSSTGFHCSRSLSASPSSLVRRTPLSPPDSRRRAMYRQEPFTLPEIETDPSEVISDKSSGMPSQFAEAPER